MCKAAARRDSNGYIRGPAPAIGGPAIGGPLTGGPATAEALSTEIIQQRITTRKQKTFKILNMQYCFSFRIYIRGPAIGGPAGPGTVAGSVVC
jgi:hypothetical protein